MTQINSCVEDLSGKGFEERIKKNIVVVDFFAEWCMPCVMMSPVIEDMAEKFLGKIDFCKINIDENEKIASKFNVMSIPTLIIFKKGKEAGRITGSLPNDILEEKLRKFI